MKYEIKNSLDLEDRTMKEVYCDILIEMAKNNEKIVIFDADLMNSIGTVKFKDIFPKRTINCGIQEANMIGVASGISETGFVPFVHTFACFATRRVADQVFISSAFSKADIRIIGSDPGITAELNGGTHMSFEDIGIMRSIPSVTIIEPTDTTMLEDIIRKVSNMRGVYYIRICRKKIAGIYKKGSTFDIGKGVILREGNEVTLIASGITVADSLRAAEKLEKMGISAKVVNLYTIKPIDKEIIIQSAKETGAVVTIENHNIINGLGSAVSEVLIENYPVPMERMGINDSFGQVGDMNFLKKVYGFTEEDIIKKAIRVIKRKIN